MKVLVTGDKGFVGSHLIELLDGAIGIDIKDNDVSMGLNMDIRSCYLPPDVTHIFHLAAKRSVPVGEQEPEEFISTNCWGTARLLRHYPKARILNISSSAAEEARSVYGATKLFAEKIGLQHPNCLNVRLYNVFGERQPLESGAVVPAFINAKIKGEKPVVYGYGTPVRDFTYVGDVVYELKRLMFETEDRGLAHVGYSDSISVNDLLKMIYGYMPERTQKTLRSFEIKDSRSPYSMKKIVYGRKEGIRRTIEWWMKKYE